MPRTKLTQEDIEEIKRLLKEGYDAKKLAERYGVNRSTIYIRAKYPMLAEDIPVETKTQVIKAIKQDGYTKAEAAQLYGLNIGTVVNFTKDIKGHRRQGNHIIRQQGIKLLNRLMSDGYLISDFVVSTVRNLQRHFPMIMSARYKDKTFFYLKGREAETIEAFFREKPDRIINYHVIEELAYLLGVEISNKERYNLMNRFKGKHEQYWRSRRLIQRSIDDWIDEQQYSEISFRLMSKQ
jgi:hypothetical protein